MMAVRFKLNNLVVIVDNNNLQALDRTNAISSSLAKKFTGFGCTCECINGHDFDELTTALKSAGSSAMPTVIIANTVKGNGVSFMQDKLEWHYKSPNQAEYGAAKKEILEQKNFIK
jgi:transketolase